MTDGAQRPGSGAASPIDTRNIFAKFDAAYESTWPAEAGQFWSDRYAPGQAAYANLVHARNRRVRALIGEGDALLDIGSGYGDLLFLLRDRFHTIRGIDPSAKSCAMATYNLASRQVGNDWSFDVGVAERLPLPDRAFDAVTMLDTYEHVEPDARAAALGEIRRVLRPGGRLIIVTPSRRALKFWALFDNLLMMRRQRMLKRKHGRPIEWMALPKKDYCEVFPTRRELLADVRRAGFRVQRFERCSFYPAPERGGYFHHYLGHLPGDHPRLRLALRIVNAGERLGFLGQKMLLLAEPEGAP